MIFIDLETTVDGGPNGDSPEAHWLNNKVLLCGYQVNNQRIQIDTDVTLVCALIQEQIVAVGECWVVAHNAKFDLKYLMRDCPSVDWHKVRVWDTMTWEYLASGHAKKFTSIVAACADRGILMAKTLDLGALLANGVKMQDIPKTELRKYLRGDVQGLYDLYVVQATTFFYPDMDYILPLCEMELRGLPIEREKATKLATKLTKETNKHYTTLTTWIKAYCQWQDGSPIIDDDFSPLIGTKSKTIKPMSNRTLSFLLWGSPSELKITPKWRVQFVQGNSHVINVTKPTAVYGTRAQPSAQGWPMGEDDLKKILSVTSLLSCPIINATLAYRSSNKLLGTYVTPFLSTSKVQGAVYPKLNTTVTNTGRLSSSGPNGQNIPPAARQLIVPDKEGDEIVEIDFQQLEMVGAATLSGDPAMIKDLRDGVDLHYKTGTKVMGWQSEADMKKEERTLVKNVNFGVLYGGKAKGLSHQTGVDKALVQQLIDSFYNRYPRVATWQKDLFKEVCSTMKTHDIKEGEQRYASMYTLPQSGRQFKFIQAQSPEWLRRRTGRAFSFSPQHIANYPIQGFAGGDLVMSALLYLWVMVHATNMADKIKFRMTVHDSIVLQVEKGINLNLVLKKMCEYVKDKYNLPVDLHVDVDRGSTWQ